MSKKIILIILIFILMMNLLIGVMYATEETQENIAEEIASEVIEGESDNINTDTIYVSGSQGNSATNYKKESDQINQRVYFLISTIIIFVVLLAFIERLKTLKIVLRVLITTIIIYFVFINMIARDYSIVLTSILAILLIAISNVLIKNGIKRKAFAELISVLIMTAFVTIATYIVARIYNIQLLNDSLQRFKVFSNNNHNIFAVGSLLFLGIFMDIISSFVIRLDDSKDKTIDISLKEQFKTGLKIGKELITEKFNMIFLIFIGISILTICVFIKDGFASLELITIDQIFLLLTFVVIGSIGIVLSIPVTSIIYGTLNNKKTIYKTVPENRIDGKRSLKL